MPVPGRHFEKEAILAFLDVLLDRVDGPLLIGTQETQAVDLNKTGAFRLVFPTRLISVTGPLCQSNIIFADLLFYETLRVGLDVLISLDGIGIGESGDEIGAAPLQIPEVVQIAVGKDNEAAVLRARIFAGLLFANEWILVFGLCLQNDERKALFIQEEEIDEAVFGFFKILAKLADAAFGEFDVRLKLDVGLSVFIVEEPPAGIL